MMKAIVVLAMHGAPPLDFPREELQEFFQLQAQEHQGPQANCPSPRLKELEDRLRNFPRQESNDPFWKGSRELAAALEKACGLPVVVGFNEFCAPGLDQALDQAAGGGAEKIIIATPMMTRGGQHAQGDIPAAIDRARQRHPRLTFIYAWPFPIPDVAAFLAKEIKNMAGL